MEMRSRDRECVRVFPRYCIERLDQPFWRHEYSTPTRCQRRPTAKLDWRVFLASLYEAAIDAAVSCFPNRRPHPTYPSTANDQTPRDEAQVRTQVAPWATSEEQAVEKYVEELKRELEALEKIALSP
jgi:hypothetical protein